MFVIDQNEKKLIRRRILDQEGELITWEQITEIQFDLYVFGDHVESWSKSEGSVRSVGDYVELQFDDSQTAEWIVGNYDLRARLEIADNRFVDNIGEDIQWEYNAFRIRGKEVDKSSAEKKAVQEKDLTFPLIYAELDPSNEPIVDAPVITLIQVPLQENIRIFYDPVEFGTAYEYQVDGGAWVDIGTTNPIALDWQILNPNTEYSIKLRGKNNAGAGPESAASTFTTRKLAPEDAPVITNIEEASNSATVTFAAVDRADEYEYRINSGTIISIGSATEFEINDLTENTTYTLELRGKNNGGSGPWVTQQFTTLDAALVVAPTISEADGSGFNGTLTIVRTSVAGATGYEYRVDGGAAVSVGTTNPFVIPGLDFDTQYQVEARAVNSAGPGPWSNTLNLTTAIAPPADPVIDNIDLAFDEVSVAFSGSPTADTFEYRLDGGTVVEGVQSSPIVLNNLNELQTYTFELRARNEGGPSGWVNDEFTVPEEPLEVPTVEENLGVHGGFPNTPAAARFRFTNIAGETGYEYRLDGGDPVQLPKPSDALTFVSVNAPVNDYDTQYSVEVRALNDNQQSDWSDPVNCFSIPQPPEPVETVDINPSADSVSIDITASARMSGYRYELKLRGASNVPGSGVLQSGTVDQPRGGALQDLVLSGLSSLTEYDLYIYPLNWSSLKPSEYSITHLLNDFSRIDPFLFTTTDVAPTSAPTITDVQPTEDGAIVSRTGVSGAAEYEYRLNGGDPISVNTTNPFTITGQAGNTNFDLEVRAKNSGGSGPYSDVSSFLTLPDAAPVATIGETTPSTVDVTYTNVSGDGSLTYQYKIGEGGSWVTVTGGSFQVTGLDPDTQYDLFMRVTNASGAGPASAAVPFTTDPALAAPVIDNENVETTLTTATIPWGAVAGATGYRYRINGGDIVDAGDVTQVIIEDLQPGSYLFELRAYNATSQSVWADQMIVLPELVEGDYTSPTFTFTTTA